MHKVGFIGWRGMVCSVLMQRMLQNNDFSDIEPIFFTTSQLGQAGPAIGKDVPPLQDAFDLKALSKLDILVSCQGGSYSNTVYRDLRKQGWQGYWLDAASAFRMESDSIIVLDPVNRQHILNGLKQGTKTFCGGNCTVSLMLMAMQGLFQNDLIAWLSSMTYQSASGAGAKQMKELVAQMAFLGERCGVKAKSPAASALEVDQILADALSDREFPNHNWNVPLAASLIPWIDTAMENGQTREEWKGQAETNKILARQVPVPIDGQCVRVGTMRCHAQGLTIKLKQDIPLDEIADMLTTANRWCKFIPNTKHASSQLLTPAAVSGTLEIPVGRLRKMSMGNDFLACFTVGDQLLWGAAEPLRRMLRIFVEH